VATRIKHGRRRRGYTRLSSKRQVTVPLEVVDQLRLNPGDEFLVQIDDGRIVLEPVESLRERRLKAIKEIAGDLTGVWPPGALDRLRDEWR
jgi:AbrB family looped-hinge helix DNA binding protein